MGTYQPRLYREEMNSERFHFFPSVFMESDLLVGIPSGSPSEVRDRAASAVLAEQKRLYSLIRSIGDGIPDFLSSLEPVDIALAGMEAEPDIATMARCAVITGTGPMSCVAGLFAEAAGRVLLEKVGIAGEVVVENGGDLYMRNQEEALVLIHAGGSELSGKVGLKIPPGSRGICTSAGSHGHSYSSGRADALCVVCGSTPLADAWATAMGNKVKGAGDIESVLEFAGEQEDILSCLIIAGGQMGIVGELELSVTG